MKKESSFNAVHSLNSRQLTVALVGTLFALFTVHSEILAQAHPLIWNSEANIDGYISDQYKWIDSKGTQRSAAMVKNDRTDPAGRKGGYLRQLIYGIGGAQRIVNGSSEDQPGLGYLVNHYSNEMGGGAYVGSYETGNYRNVFIGRHHAVHQYKWQISMKGYPVEATVHWFFATGRDHPVFGITYDCSQIEPNAIECDTRSPYGDMQWDGGVNSDVEGLGWGDRYKFETLNSPVTMSSGWSYSEPNTVPYCYEYSNSADAEMGLVQTQTYLQHDAGGYWNHDNWGKTNAKGPMPEPWNWTYQMNQYQLPDTKAKRLAWGSNFGAVGETEYSVYGDDGMAVGYPYQSYSVSVVLDKHSLSPVASQVAQVENIQSTILTAKVGTVVTSGLGGIARSDSVTYEPAGYNPIYSTWEINSVSGNAAYKFTIETGFLVSPMFVIRNYTPTNPPSMIQVNSMAKRTDVDYFASLDDYNDILWITLRGNYTGSNDVVIFGNGNIQAKKTNRTKDMDQ